MEQGDAWLPMAQNVVLDSMRSLIGVLASGEALPGPSVDQPLNKLLAVDISRTSNSFGGEGDIPRCIALLVSALGPLAKGVEAVPRQKGLALLLSVPHEATPRLHFLGALKRLWWQFGREMEIEQQAEFDTHALVAATAVRSYEDFDDDEDDGNPDPLGPAASVGASGDQRQPAPRPVQRAPRGGDRGARGQRSAATLRRSLAGEEAARTVN